MDEPVRQDGGVPRYITPPDMPAEVETIIDVVGSRVRLGMLRELAGRGPLTTPELKQLTTASDSVANGHLRALEAAGLISADVPAGQRRGRGRGPTWTIEREAVAPYVDQLRRYILKD